MKTWRGSQRPQRSPVDWDGGKGSLASSRTRLGVSTQDHSDIYPTPAISLFALTDHTIEASGLFQGPRNELLAKGQAGQRTATLSSWHMIKAILMQLSLPLEGGQALFVTQIKNSI